jgi:dihydrofolate synthase/folylpolyglutamate synthase
MQGKQMALLENAFPEFEPQEPVPLTSADILQRFCRARDGEIRLELAPAYLDLLKKLGDPHKKLPPVIHVAGTNGKGSVCAFLRAILEAGGYRVHVFTSPHLTQFHERIRIAGKMISEEELIEIFCECERYAPASQVSDFEITTAAAFTAFARHPADVTIIEVGMGGRLDATNVIEKPAASVITRLSYDHCKYLGNTLTNIAREKAGIMRNGVPCFAAPQPQAEAFVSLCSLAVDKNVPFAIGGMDWNIEIQPSGFRYTDAKRTLDMPPPSLIGIHQYWNAGLAIAALSALPFSLTPDDIAEGLQKAEWPARLQHIHNGMLARLLPEGWELWLDGGHNDSAAEVLAAQMEEWHRQDGKPLYLICGMLSTKDAQAFLRPLVPYAATIHAVPVPGESLSFPAAELAEHARHAGLEYGAAARDVIDAVIDLTRKPSPPARILICGSLYLAGDVLQQNEE